MSNIKFQCGHLTKSIVGDKLSGFMRELARSIEPEPAPQRFEMAGATQASPKHPDRREDALAFDERAEFAALSDGAAQEGGAEASNETIKFVIDAVGQLPAKLDAALWRDAIGRIMREASAHVRATANARGIPRLAATLEIAKVVRSSGKNPELVFGHLGDSALVEITADGTYRRLTEPHSLLGVLEEEIEYERAWRGAEIRRGRLPQDAIDDLPAAFLADEPDNRISFDALLKVANSAYGRPMRQEHMRALQKIVEEHMISAARKNIQPGDLQVGAFHDLLTQAVGAEDPMPQVSVMPLRPGARYVIMSDGVFRGLSKEQIAQIVSSQTAKDAAEALVARSTEADDRSAIVFGEEAAPAKAA